jgi:coenzyme F420-reducing hydrogenase alpha subunit
MEIPESPRFFEAMLLGRRWYDASHLTSRICGICAVAHTFASLRAVEDAMSVEISEQTLMLRELAMCGEMLQSHMLHVYFLAAPDLLGVGSVFPLIQTHKDVVLRAMRLKKLGNEISGVIGGRHTHPISMVPGGFTRVPTAGELEALVPKLEKGREDIEATVELFKTLSWPDFERDTEYLSLTSDRTYAFYAGDIASTDGGTTAPQSYLDVIHEEIMPHSTAKHAASKRDSYAVGALARYKNNHDQLHDRAKKAADALGLGPDNINPFFNNTAQIVESVHAIEESLRLIGELVGRGLEDEKPSVKPRAGRGVGATEAPRGLLIHDYTFDDEGICVGANCVIPTAQNYANIELDMKALVPQIVEKPREEITLTLEMLVRAYDPCISCSTHLLEVSYVE